jgi:predicted amidophosphoribosyltransferase
MLPLGWFLITPCPLCGQDLERPKSAAGQACRACCERLELPEEGLMGVDPLPWWGAGRYGGGLRNLLLDLRRRPRIEAVAALARGTRRALAITVDPQQLRGWRERPLLVPIPSWKRRANPLPPLFCRALERGGDFRHVDLLERSRPVLGQHRLGRSLRIANQVGAFRCLRPPGPGEARRRPVLIVDDILTTGATATSAAQCLAAAGWRVEGVLCLARTVARGADQAVP